MVRLHTTPCKIKLNFNLKKCNWVCRNSLYCFFKCSVIKAFSQLPESIPEYFTFFTWFVFFRGLGMVQSRMIYQLYCTEGALCWNFVIYVLLSCCYMFTFLMSWLMLLLWHIVYRISYSLCITGQVPNLIPVCGFYLTMYFTAQRFILTLSLYPPFSLTKVLIHKFLLDLGLSGDKAEILHYCSPMETRVVSFSYCMHLTNEQSKRDEDKMAVPTDDKQVNKINDRFNILLESTVLTL